MNNKEIQRTKKKKIFFFLFFIIALINGYFKKFVIFVILPISKNPIGNINKH